ncbi:MAG: hypothetical protein AMDU4_FER2C00091G0009 [Ferroplasma sp. Type II]|jgi:putative transposase|nr:MAG: hypothetical protein AMDU4_FER2C00091G0009 [Ferroplasma sp. Type II]
MEVMPDHMYLLIDINHRLGVYHVINQIKGYSSSVLRNEFPALKRKLPAMWTHSKFISIVGSVTLESVQKYMEDQRGKDINIQYNA